MLRTSIAIGCGAAVIVAVCLAGCAPSASPVSKGPSAHRSTAPSASTTSTPNPTAAGLGPLPSNALFRITATATAADGAVADLTQTVFQPAAMTPADTALLNSECNYPGVPDLQGSPTWQSQYASPMAVATTMTSTLHSGSRPWSTDDSILFDYLENVSAYSGSYTGFEAYCSPGMLVVPGTVHGVSPVPSADPVGGTLGWAGTDGTYGFLGGGNLLNNDDLGGTAVISNCAIELSATAKAAGPAIAAWATQPYVKVNGCTYVAPGAS